MTINKYLSALQDLSNQEIIITGGTSGIGLAIVKLLLEKNAKVVILARNMAKAETIKNELLSLFPHRSIDIIEYDQSDESKIDKAIKMINELYPKFNALICNAGVFSLNKDHQPLQKMGLTIKTNYYGLYLLMEGLLRSNHYPHRYIFQGSLAAGLHLKRIKTLHDLNISPWQQYLIAKAGVEQLFAHYCNTYQGPSSFVLVEPGITNTEIIRDFVTPIRQLGKGFLKFFTHSNKKAALTALLALEKTTNNHCFIVPRGLFTTRGYPKIRSFPKKRERQYLIDMLLEERQFLSESENTTVQDNKDNV